MRRMGVIRNRFCICEFYQDSQKVTSLLDPLQNTEVWDLNNQHAKIKLLGCGIAWFRWTWRFYLLQQYTLRFCNFQILPASWNRTESLLTTSVTKYSARMYRKGKPIVRWGRKAMDPMRAARLPKFFCRQFSLLMLIKWKPAEKGGRSPRSILNYDCFS